MDFIFYRYIRQFSIAIPEAEWRKEVYWAYRFECSKSKEHGADSGEAPLVTVSHHGGLDHGGNMCEREGSHGKPGN
jgi:hypothetical protein